MQLNAKCFMFHASVLPMSVLIVAWEVVEVAISVVGQWLFHNERFRVRVFLDFPAGVHYYLAVRNVFLASRLRTYWK